jgi:sugar/nucleoside kinase (ribokinase family)
MPIADALEFSNAMAALNCTAPGARGRIANVEEACAFMQSGISRREHAAIALKVQAG